jgi:hypothetical protein
MDGRVLMDLFSTKIQNRQAIKQTDNYGQTITSERQWSAAEESELKDRLDDLGYLG